MRVAKLLSTSITAAALAFSMLASTIPAVAAPGDHAAYFSESSFLTLAPGQSGQFAAGFSNTGDSAWTKGSSTAQASLRTRNGDTSLSAAGWGSTWFNSTTYANQANDLVAPGQVGFFIYNVSVPAAAAAGPVTFSGIPWFGNTALEDYGYYQIVTVAQSAVSITSSSPASPSTTTTPTISGTGATATTLVTVQEGSTSLCTATASSTGTFSCTVTALSVGSHAITATAPGQGTSTVFTYVVDTAAPTIASVTAASLQRIVVCYNKAMTTAGFYNVQTSGKYVLSPATVLVSAASDTIISADAKCLTITFGGTNSLVNNTAYTLTVSNVADAAGNPIAASSTASFATADATVPTATGITQPGTQTIIVTFSETITAIVAANFKWDSSATTFTPMTAIGANTAMALLRTSGSSATSDVTSRQVRLTFPSGVTAATGAHTLDVSGVTDLAGNVISPNPTSFTVTIASDTTRPTVTSATASRGDFSASAGYLQTIAVNFSEGMQHQFGGWAATNAIDANLASIHYTLSNPDGTAATTGCSATGTPILLAGATSISAGSSQSHASGGRWELKTARLYVANTNTYTGLSQNLMLSSGCQYTLTVKDVMDQAGNAINANPTLITISDTADTSAFSVTSVTANSGTITVCYNKVLTATTNFLGAASGTQVPGNVTSVGTSTFTMGAFGIVDYSGKCAIFNFAAPIASGTYSAQITGVTDGAGNALSPNPTTATVTFGDATTPVLATATLVSNNALTVTFTKGAAAVAMTGGATPTNSAGNVINYSLSNNTYGSICTSGIASITSAATGSFSILCTGTDANLTGVNILTGVPTGGAGTGVVTVRNVADQNGNVLSPNPASKSF